MQDANESNEDRLARRRVRRWHRRARLFAPFLAVPGVLGVLMLSVNLIEHRPAASRNARSTTRAAALATPAPRAPEAALRMPVELRESGSIGDPRSLSQASTLATAIAADMPLAPGLERMGAATENALFDAPAATTHVAGGR